MRRKVWKCPWLVPLALLCFSTWLSFPDPREVAYTSLERIPLASAVCPGSFLQVPAVKSASLAEVSGSGLLVVSLLLGPDTAKSYKVNSSSSCWPAVCLMFVSAEWNCYQPPLSAVDLIFKINAGVVHGTGCCFSLGFSEDVKAQLLNPGLSLSSFPHPFYPHLTLLCFLKSPLRPQHFGFP